MNGPPLVGIVLAALLAASSQDPDRERSEPKVSELVVRAENVVGMPTRRASTTFEFQVIRVEHDGAGVAGKGGSVREGKIGFRSFMGADKQGAKDAATRVLEFLRARPAKRPEDPSIERAYELGETGELRLLIVRAPAPVGELWVLQDEAGDRVTVAPRRAR